MKYKQITQLNQDCFSSGVDVHTIISLLDYLEGLRVMLNVERDCYDDADIKQHEQIQSSLIQILEWIGVKSVISDWDKVKRGEMK